MGLGLKNWFNKAKADIIDSAGELIDKTFTNDEERLTAKNQLADLVMTKLNEGLAMQRDVLVAEIQGNGLQRNWRPLVMLAFAGIIVYEYFVAPLFSLTSANLPGRFFDLLEIGLGGYVIGRSVEKVAESVTKNVDISFLKKKDRTPKNTEPEG